MRRRFPLLVCLMVLLALVLLVSCSYQPHEVLKRLEGPVSLTNSNLEEWEVYYNGAVPYDGPERLNARYYAIIPKYEDAVTMLVEEDGSYYSKSGNVIWVADRFMDSKATKRLEYAHRGEFGLLYDDRVPKPDQPYVVFGSASSEWVKPSRSTIDFLDWHLPRGWEKFSQ